MNQLLESTIKDFAIKNQKIIYYLLNNKPFDFFTKQKISFQDMKLDGINIDKININHIDFLSFLENNDLISSFRLLIENKSLKENALMDLELLSGFSKLKNDFIKQYLVNFVYNDISILNQLKKDDLCMVIDGLLIKSKRHTPNPIYSEFNHQLWSFVMENNLLHEKEIQKLFPFFYEKSTIENININTFQVKVDLVNFYKNINIHLKKKYSYKKFQDSLLKHNGYCDDLEFKIVMAHPRAMFLVMSESFDVNFLKNFMDNLLKKIQVDDTLNLKEIILITKNELEYQEINEKLDISLEKKKNTIKV